MGVHVERHVLGGAVGEVEQQGLALAREQQRALVQPPGRRSGDLGLGPPADRHQLAAQVVVERRGRRG